jgi:hypothetical protein
MNFPAYHEALNSASTCVEVAVTEGWAGTTPTNSGQTAFRYPVGGCRLPESPRRQTPLPPLRWPAGGARKVPVNLEGLGPYPMDL